MDALGWASSSLASTLAYALLRPRGKQAQRDAAAREVYRADEDERKQLG